MKRAMVYIPVILLLGAGSGIYLLGTMPLHNRVPIFIAHDPHKVHVVHMKDGRLEYIGNDDRFYWFTPVSNAAKSMGWGGGSWEMSEERMPRNSEVSTIDEETVEELEKETGSSKLPHPPGPGVQIDMDE